jgi:hypothetical protein
MGGSFSVKYFRFGLLLVATLSSQHWTAWAQSTELAKMHAQDDAAWAAHSGLGADKIRKLRVDAGVSDDSLDFIDNVDARTLALYQLVLFATYAGTARCVNLWLFSPVGDDYKALWKPEDGGEELNFCADPKCKTPVVKARPNRDVEIDIPSMHKGRCVSGSYALLKWSGSTYSYKGILEHGETRKDH